MTESVEARRANASDLSEVSAPSEPLACLLDREPRSLREQGMPERLDGIVVGTLVALNEHHEPLVCYSGQTGHAALVARTAVDLAPEMVGAEVLLTFEAGDRVMPIIVGRLRTPSLDLLAGREPQIELEADGARITVVARERIVLRCGAASITLTAAGKVLLEGAYVSLRSSGALRIKGGCVQIN